MEDVAPGADQRPASVGSKEFQLEAVALLSPNQFEGDSPIVVGALHARNRSTQKVLAQEKGDTVGRHAPWIVGREQVQSVLRTRGLKEETVGPALAMHLKAVSSRQGAPMDALNTAADEEGGQRADRGCDERIFHGVAGRGGLRSGIRREQESRFARLERVGG